MRTAEQNTPEDWRAARRALAQAVRRTPASSSGPSGQQVRQVEVPAPAANLLGWLCTQPAPRGFWKGRDEDRACAFAGVADRFEDPVRLCQHLESNAPPGAAVRYYGGVRFDPERPAADGWEAFGEGAFVLPRFELAQQSGGKAVLACHLAPGDDAEAVAAQAENLRMPALASESVPDVTCRRDRPGRRAWDSTVECALRGIAGSTLQKVVLARRTSFRFAAPLDPVALLGRLRTLAPEGFQFLFQPEGAGAFLGVSPERLFRQRGRGVWSEAVAGTRPRAATATADAALQEELLESEKDRREHAFVQRYVRDALRPLCTSLEEREAAPLTLRRGRHLYARVEGQLRKGATPADVLHALHPTPAVGGVPAGAARQFIRQHEPFDRGRYAAPVGWVGAEEGAPAAELAVGIRSGLVRKRRLDLFAGAGLVEGSEAEAEWDEVEQKLANFAAIFEEERSEASPS